MPNPHRGSAPDPDSAAGPDHWSGFDTPAHRQAQGTCGHLFHCAVDATTRRRVVEALDYARGVGDVAAVPVLLAQLTGPCCLPPEPPALSGPAAGR